jgi:hypothetical protein
MSKVIITRIQLDDVLSNPDKYNVNNSLNRKKVDDYSTVLSWSNTKNWIHQFHDNLSVISIKETKWIKQAFKIGTFTKKFSNLFMDELDDLCFKYREFDNFGEGLFVRTDHVSLKTGIHGKGPYTTLKQIIESICTCDLGHSAIIDSDEVLNIYLIPWKTIESNKDFVFLYTIM